MRTRRLERVSEARQLRGIWTERETHRDHATVWDRFASRREDKSLLPDYHSHELPQEPAGAGPGRLVSSFDDPTNSRAALLNRSRFIMANTNINGSDPVITLGMTADLQNAVSLELNLSSAVQPGTGERKLNRFWASGSRPQIRWTLGHGCGVFPLSTS